MRSPFAVFRKHQKVLLVVLTGLAMFAFIFMDQMTQSGGQGLLPMMGLMLGALVFWIVGARTGKASSYAVLGAALGLGLGLLGPRIGGTNAAVETTVGDLSGPELEQLVTHRRLANNFVAAAFQTVNPMPDDMSGQGNIFAQFFEQRLSQLMFRVNPNYSQEQLEADVVLGYLLRHQANKMGVFVSDETVTGFIKDVSTPVFSRDRGSLTEKEFRDLRKRLQLKDEDLYDILRDELQAVLMRDLLAPSGTQTPDQRWQDFRKINVKQTLEAAAVNVQPFAEATKDPLEGELQGFLEKYDEVYPSQLGKGKPGFHQPRRVRLAYLEADYETVEQTMAEVSEADITAHYEENKEVLYRIQTIPDAPESPQTPESGPESGPDLPESAPDLPESTEARESTPDLPATTVPPDSAPERPQTPDSGKAPEDSQTPEPPARESSAGDKTDDLPAVESKSATKGDKQKPGSGTETEAPEKSDPDCSPESPTPEAAQNESQSKDTPAAQSPKSADNQQTQPDKSQADSEAKNAPENVQPELDQQDMQPTEEVEKPKGPPPPALPRTVNEVDGPKYRPLDDDLISEIRDQLLDQLTKQAMQDKIDMAMAEMSNLAYQHIHSDENDSKYLTPVELSDRLKDFAKQNDLRYVVTKLLSATELRDSENHSIGTATEPTDFPSSSADVPTVVDMIFGSRTEQSYAVQQAEDIFNTQNRFAYWVIEVEPAHVPTLREDETGAKQWEEGLKEQVLEAWKIQQGRPKALKRATEFAGMVREALAKDDASMSQALKDQSIVEDRQVIVRSTFEFSWLTRSSVPNLNPFQPSRVPPVRLTTIPEIENLDNDFMKAVAALAVNQVSVIPNADLSIYYVVRLKNRTPGNPTAVTALQSQFLAEDLFTNAGPYSALANDSQGRSFVRWVHEFERDYIERWNPRPNIPGDGI